MAAALARLGAPQDRLTLFSSSWKDRLATDAVPGAATVDARVPVSLLNAAWHRLQWPPMETLGAEGDVAWSLTPLLMPSRSAAQVVTVHDLFFLDHPDATAREVRRDYVALAAAHARRADGVIVISEYTREQAVRRLGVDPARVTVCPPGAPAWAPRQVPATPGPILHVGTLEPRKNIGAILRGYERLRATRPSAPPLVFAGKAEQPPAPQPSVEFRGYVSEEERQRLFRDASMLVMASLDEGFGLPALEAMTIGLPVIVPGRGSLPEVVGDAALLVDVDDPDAFAAAMGRLLDADALRRDLAARGIVRAKAFSWERSAARAREAFAAAIERRKERR